MSGPLGRPNGRKSFIENFIKPCQNNENDDYIELSLMECDNIYYLTG